MQCINCNKEYEGKSKYCCESCKTVYNRNKRNNVPPEQSEPEQQKPEQIPAGTVEPEQTVTEPDYYWPWDEYETFDWLPVGVSKPCHPDVSCEPAWRSSDKYIRLIHDLTTKDIETLEAEGYWIPAWRADWQKEAA